ncbi:hypothetical protein GCM10017044_28650 [Kordiimonas sediminis]|uniref:Uncharacterized protein n=1 Tax=Kordiimonas sediminis TaxID=1735581 RepID=A0A919EBG0_9PROT|nr:hypothetical protein [Kordiimonas sediminis]GHF31373.1 hypothetical protein GCM10017044_28650 [Kordiimonas sediminis]
MGEAIARVGIAAGSGPLGVGVGARVGNLALKGARALSSARTVSVAQKVGQGATAGATASAVAETGLQTNQAITGNGFDVGEVVEAATIGAVTGGVGGAAEGAIVKVVQATIPEASGVVVTGVRGQAQTTIAQTQAVVAANAGAI